MTERSWPLQRGRTGPIGRARPAVRPGTDEIERPGTSPTATPAIEADATAAGDASAIGRQRWRMPERSASVSARRVAANPVRSVLWIVAPATAISSIVILASALGSGVLAAAGGGLALLAALVVPEVGLGVLAALAPQLPPPGIPAPGLSFLLAGALLLGCVYRLPLDRPRLRLSRSGLFLLGFVVYVTAQQMPDLLDGYQSDQGHAVGYLFFQVLTGFGMVLAAGYILRGRSPIPVLATGLFGVLVATTVAVATFENPVPWEPLGRLVAVADEGLRAAGPFVNPNYMGTFAAAVLVGIVALWSAVGSRIGRVLLVGVAVLCLIAIVQAQSRGAMIAGFAGVVAVVWLRSRPIAIALAGIGIVGAVLVYPAFVEWRLTNLRGDVTDAGYVAMAQSDDARLQASLAAPAMFLAEPVFGVGFGQFVTKSVEISGLTTGINAHNWYVNVLAEQGTTGALLWLGATVATGLELLRRRGVARAVGIGAFTTLAVGFLFLEGPTSFQFVAVPSLFLMAGLVSDWSAVRPGQAGAGDVVESTEA
jgi:hypothetical protein